MAELGPWKRRNSREMREQGTGSVPWYDVTRGHSEWECAPFLAFLAFPHSVLLQSVNQPSHPFALDLISPHSPLLIPPYAICSNSVSTFSLILTLSSCPLGMLALTVAWSLKPEAHSRTLGSLQIAPFVDKRMGKWSCTFVEIPIPWCDTYKEGHGTAILDQH